MKRKRSSPAEEEVKEENNEYTYDDDENELTNGYLQEADVSNLPTHLFRNLKKIKCTPGDGEELTAEELISAANEGGEVWIIKCPKNVNPNAVFSGKKVSLEDDDVSILNTLSDTEDLEEIINKPKHLIKKRKTTYEALTLCNNGATNSVVTMLPDSEGNRRIVAAPVTGTIMIRESIEDVPIVNFVKKEVVKKVLPPGLKHHHPIYGVDFSHAENMSIKKETKNYKIKNSQDSFENEFLEPAIKKKKKKKKNKHKESETDETQDESMSESQSVYSAMEEEIIENNHIKKKKSKKRKREQDEEQSYNLSSEYTETEQEELCSPKKKKHKKSKF